MHAWVYASQRKSDTYVWLRERDAFALLPAALLDTLGSLHFVLETELDASRRLPREDAREVLAHLTGQGWHLQLPPPAETAPRTA